ncbi:efflux RND transporter periplasmic adaptor subunit [Leptotrichia sp. oral taxon 212]|uniref:efflux RND transporter periplasmic adaptor subunit n=1 Tax=Leptotrichia sp. oral taxon 212 TaxID=712357 RepID=UPI000B327738|nr:efflux RND transporter periplasmic adaptor subunit [Leptotrichia sp. oral taxon 212]
MINNNLSAKKRIYSNMMKTMAVIIMTGIFAISCGKKKEKKAEENLRPVKVQTVGQNTISLGYTVSGTIKGKEEIPYTATSSGEVTVVNGKNGDYVNAGQVIIAIDNQAARANAMSASSNYEAARINYEKYRTLYNKRLVTETEYLNAKTNYDSARANLQTANDSNSKSVIRTNVNGVLANLNIERHQQVAAGQSLFTLVNESEMILEVGVSPQIVGKIQVGTTAKVKIDELNKEVEGEVYEISGAAQNATRQFLVKIKMQNPDRELKSGMYGTASIDTGAEEGVVIPKESIVVRGVEQIVYIIKDGKAVAIPIKIVNQNETYAAVTGDGLAVGSELVVDGQNVVQDGEKVKKVN